MTTKTRPARSAPEAAAAASKTATYLYALVKCARAPSLAKAPKGLPRASAPRAIDAGNNLWLVVADAPLDRYDSESIERGLRDMSWVGACATGHEAVVEHAAKSGTIVPMKLFTLFASDERALGHIAKMRAKLERVIAKIAGCDEWGVRVLFDPARAMRAAAERVRSETKGAASGASFLLRKKRENEAARELGDRAHDQVDAIFAALSKRAVDATRRAPVSSELRGRVLLDAVFLVPDKRATGFRQLVKSTASSLAATGYDVALSGPWPAYHFIGSATS